MIFSGDINLYNLNYDTGIEYISVNRRADQFSPIVKNLDISITIGIQSQFLIGSLRDLQIFLLLIFSGFILLSTISAIIMGNRISKPILFGGPEYLGACSGDEGRVFFATSRILSEHKYLGALLRGFLLLHKRVAISSINNSEKCAPIGTNDELEDLAIAFDIRTGKLLENKSTLEERVENIKISNSFLIPEKQNNIIQDMENTEKEQIISQWENLLKTPGIRQSLTFGQTIIKLGSQLNNKNLTEWGMQLMKITNNFDTEQIIDFLKKNPVSLEGIEL